MYMYSIKYLNEELQKCGYIAYPSGRLGQTCLSKLYTAGNIHIHVCYKGSNVKRIDILDFGEADLAMPLRRYVATTSNNEVFRYSDIPLEDFIQIILGPPSGIVMRLENEMNRKALETLE